MSSRPTPLTLEQFGQYGELHLRKATRGFVSTIPLDKIFTYLLSCLPTGCQGEQLPLDKDLNDPDNREISPEAGASHVRTWSREGRLNKVWQESRPAIQEPVDWSELKLDGSHPIAQKGGESVADQGRKKAKPRHGFPSTDQNGALRSSTEMIAGNHHDAFKLKPPLQAAFKDIKQMGLDIAGASFNADRAFATKDARKTGFNHNVMPNIAENKRNRKRENPGPRRLFDEEGYTHRLSSERTVAWVDKFKRLLLRFERKDVDFFGLHCIAFAMITLRHLIS